jgi:hypothetical protein
MQSYTLMDLFGLDDGTVRQCCQPSMQCKREAWMGSSILYWTLSNFLWNSNEGDSEGELTKARSRYADAEPPLPRYQSCYPAKASMYQIPPPLHH